ncbi:hypothetical protein [Leeuwenhoekiella nanhaiensis]|uniref:Uncharacterized protein n=1 Tax=Leeuwenhoekiella nanhaiensis TaxID=1655491 RepID=A0A2G1VX14_9FLAO|nr:hypothetical protein [Leeuwenhoekiella nanhaiensis]PHQ30969.1 hypothetical protein CJ305_01710 [Leeuwenhoekiella nanhaiensis]
MSNIKEMVDLKRKISDYFEFGMLENRENKDEFINGLLKINEKHQSFFANKSLEKNSVENYIAPNSINGKKLIGFRNESELTPELKSDIIELWNSTFRGDHK